MNPMSNSTYYRGASADGSGPKLEPFAGPTRDNSGDVYQATVRCAYPSCPENEIRDSSSTRRVALLD